MKLFKISSLILLIIILFAGYFFPYVAPNRGPSMRKDTGPGTGVHGSKPPKGGIP
ncbi:hypothetical protein LguiA_030051 [Lonicera macranthoides]